MHSQMRIISKEKRDSVIQSARKLTSIAELSFDSLSVDFGVAAESDSPITAKFHFVNKGSSKITISGVTTSCSCLTATLSRYNLSPGQSAEIIAKYDQTGHPGRHDRYVYLYVSDAKTGSSTLAATVMLTGVVIPQGADLSDYPVKLGYFSFDKPSVTFTVGKASKQTLRLVNTSDSARELSFSTGLLPSFLTVTPSIIRIPSGGECEVILEYNGDSDIISSKKGISLLFDGAGINRLSSKIDVFFIDY